MGIFGVVCATRMSGKTTLAGTLPGKTLLLQASLLETASKAAIRLAAKKGNEIEVQEWSSVSQLKAQSAPEAVKGFDNVYVDGISAMTELLEIQPDIAKIMNKNVWDGYRMLGRQMTDALLHLKMLSMNTDINVLCTMAMDATLDPNGNIAALKPVAKGNVTLAQIQKICPIVLTIHTTEDEDGRTVRRLVTRSNGVYPGRIDDILEEDNGGLIEADLSLLLKYLEEGAIPYEIQE